MNYKEYIKEISSQMERNPGIEIKTSFGLDFDENQEAYDSLNSVIKNYNEVSRELTQLRESLNTTKKLESLGTMAAGIAHEFNNVLQPIAGFSDIMLHSEGLPDSHYEWLEIISKSAYRGSAIVDQIMNYSRKDQDHKKAEISLSELLSEFFDMISLSKDLHVELELDNFTPRDTMVYVNQSEMHQVLINLYNNAMHAVKDRNPGIVKVLASTTDQQSSLDGGDETYVSIEVVDNGYGIPKENHKKIFDPFFTTKKIGEGTGLGLSVIEKIVKGNGGKIILESEEGKGTTFRVLLKKVVEK
jgi:signal transduction histidine kinase